METDFHSELSSHDSKSITVRERDLVDEVMDDMDFTEAMIYLWIGREPSEGEKRILNAILSSLMVHGKTASAISSRLTLMSEPDAVQGAVAAGIIGVGSRFIGSMKECSEELQSIHCSENPGAEVSELVDGYLDRGESFPGIGHPHLDPVDPRAEELFRIAREEDIVGEHVEILRDIQNEFIDNTGADLPINVTGAIAAVTADMDLSPTIARLLAVMSRAAGVSGEIIEEQKDPFSRDIWRFVDENTTEK